MSTAPARIPQPASVSLPLLANGDRMTQVEFHRRYEAYPEDIKFELIGGIVYMASPVGWPHAGYHLQMGVAFELYAAGTPGVEAGDNATTILGKESEPQPDLTLRIVAECGGQSWLQEGKYVQGPPELLAEIAHSTRAMDLHQKKDDYRQAGVREYVVLCMEEQQLYWFRFPSGRLLKANRQGIYRSQIFSGLWIDGPALLNRDTPRLVAAVQQGLASREHAAFVKRLQNARRRSS